MTRKREKAGTDRLGNNKIIQVLKINPSFLLNGTTSRKIVPSPGS